MSLEAEVRKRVVPADVPEQELMVLLLRLQLAPKGAVTLDDCEPDRLVMVLNDWDTCLDRLGETRKLVQGAA